MSWRPDGNHEAGSETGKIRFDIVPYMRGRALDLGCGPTRAWPHFVGVDSGKDEELFGVPMKPNLRMDVTDLSALASESWDCIFSSHTAEHIPYDEIPATFSGWMRLLKPGGYLIFYLPWAQEYPQCGAEKKAEWEAWMKKYGAKFHNDRDAAAKELAEVRKRKGITKTGELYAGTHWVNPDHKWNCTYENVIEAMPASGWDLIEFQERVQGDEYSIYFVFKRVEGGRAFSFKNPKPQKTCAIVRYGAWGDCMILTTILPRLKEQGFHVTLYTSTVGEEVLKHNPHIDRFIIQEKDAVPPQMLGDFWSHEMKKYDRWVNLSESVEGRFLACPDRIEFWWPNQARARVMDFNYLEHAHALAQVPGPYKTEFHATEEEKAWAKATAKSFGKRNVLWSLAGSSGHKVWPHLDAVVAGLMIQYPDVHVVLCGDESCQILETGWEKEPRVHRVSGKWSMRQSLAFATYGADLVIGTETGLLNAVGCEDVPKIVNLSHSSQNMLTRHWVNATILEQPEGVGCQKRWKENGGACRQLHGGAGYSSWVDCPQHQEDGSALCQHHITAEMVFEAIRSILLTKQEKLAA